MPLSSPPHVFRLTAWRIAPPAHAAALAVAVLCSACSVFESAPPPAPPPAPVPVTAVVPAPPPVLPPPDPARPGDLVTRRLLAYHEQLRLMAPAELASEITRLGAELSPTDSASPPDVVLDLSLALAQQHNAGDLARAAGLLEPISQAARPDLLAWQPLARLIADRIAEQRRLDDIVDRQSSQLRDTQRTIQQLTEKLEALKAIERSMIKRSGPGAGGESALPGPAR